MNNSIEQGGFVYPQPANSEDQEWAGAQIGGMTLRDYFAGLAMQGMMRDAFEQDWKDAQVGQFAYDMADSMIAARKGDES